MRLAAAICFGIAAAILLLYGLYIIEDSADVSWGWIGLGVGFVGATLIALAGAVPISRR